ncbi:Hypothetical Protein FCC1311_016452 [Hondaea fermentalgiana]|uniref:Peptidase M50 domain-containing protein n=1 Tax=Hondaea fermentalgiana TaxID=2315210 RepID=A0A2R5G321_9STRA|nr:Hypothetical Protein FCC1311_016452 [Hondaea fermentalgiana]|eukprot:GBG25427.1 Hypothetical Protein FCC1311_016452 [Hondaea fermentalgiana]
MLAKIVAARRLAVRPTAQHKRWLCGPTAGLRQRNALAGTFEKGNVMNQRWPAAVSLGVQLSEDKQDTHKTEPRDVNSLLPAWSKGFQVRMLSTGAPPPPGRPPRRDEEEEAWMRQQQQQEQEEPRQKQGGLLSRGLGATATAFVILGGKMKWVLGALKFTKLMPAMSMLATTGAYALFYGWPFAVGMVGLIGIHESGHLMVMKRLGIPAGPAIFIPFMGAFVEMKDRPKDVREEALVAFGGPVVGGAAAVATSLVGISMESQMLISLADFGIMINLFNLLPIGQLDGGRIGGAISPWFLVAGLAGGGAMIYQGMVGNPIFYLVMLSGAFSTYDRFFGSGTHPTYHFIPPGQKFVLSAAYVALIVALLAAMAYNQKHRKSLAQLRAEDPERASRTSDMERRLEGFAHEWADDTPDQTEQDFINRYFRD